ncbi:MAG: HXXEE domain-containing protein [Candidatus Thorarchaeota archaeon]
MKVFKPLIIFLVLLIAISLVVGLLLPTQVATFVYSPTMYLLICFAQAGHFLEENYTKAWEVEAQLRRNADGTPKELVSSRDFLVLFSHVLVLLSFLFYFPIATQTPWALIYGLGISLNGIANGVVHTAILIKFKKNTGFISGLILLAFGILLWVSVFIPFGF